VHSVPGGVDRGARADRQPGVVSPQARQMLHGAGSRAAPAMGPAAAGDQLASRGGRAESAAGISLERREAREGGGAEAPGAPGSLDGLVCVWLCWMRAAVLRGERQWSGVASFAAPLPQPQPARLRNLQAVFGAAPEPGSSAEASAQCRAPPCRTPQLIPGLNRKTSRSQPTWPLQIGSSSAGIHRKALLHQSRGAP
jgi:hypothetical protein